MVSVWHGSVRHRALQSVKAWFRAAQNRTDDSRGECRVGVSAADGAAWISCVAGTQRRTRRRDRADGQRRLVCSPRATRVQVRRFSFVSSVLSYCAAREEFLRRFLPQTLTRASTHRGERVRTHAGCRAPNHHSHPHAQRPSSTYSRPAGSALPVSLRRHRILSNPSAKMPAPRTPHSARPVWVPCWFWAPTCAQAEKTSSAAPSPLLPAVLPPTHHAHASRR